MVEKWAKSYLIWVMPSRQPQATAEGARSYMKKNTKSALFDTKIQPANKPKVDSFQGYSDKLVNNHKMVLSKGKIAMNKDIS